MNTIGQSFGGNWTEQKLDCVRKYLKAYTTIMQLRKYNYSYIDAFAGMGYRELKNQDDPAIQRFLAGSARRALEVKRPFSNYIFIEAIDIVLPNSGNLRMSLLNEILSVSIVKPMNL